MRKNILIKFFTLLAFLSTGILLFSCKSKSQKNNETPIASPQVSPISKIEKAHNKVHFLSKKAVEFDINITFGNATILDGKITVLTNSSKATIALKDGTKIMVDQDKVFHSPEMKDSPMIRFHAYTWSYFFLLPYKLSDKGTQWSEFGKTTLNHKEYQIQKLTFAPGIGDAPDDWYYIYSNPTTNLINVAAYIVTYGNTKETAAKNPHAIAYEKPIILDHIPFATEWIFWEWSKEEGLTKQIGKATLSNLKFVEQYPATIPTSFIEK